MCEEWNSYRGKLGGWRSIAVILDGSFYGSHFSADGPSMVLHARNRAVIYFLGQ